MSNSRHRPILILDFGSQYTQLITRKIRELGVYSEIKPFNTSIDEIKKMEPKGIILSGGPASVYSESAPHPEKTLFEMPVPILGICYGLQLTAYSLGGEVTPSANREFGLARLEITDKSDFFCDISDSTQVWMSHGDVVSKLPPGFTSLARTTNSTSAAFADTDKKIYCVQFHPEVSHTVEGKQILSNFLFKVCGCRADWTPGAFVDQTVQNIREKVGNGNVLCALSGGVDSVVAAALVYKAVKEQLTCVFVDNGLMRKNETLEVERTFKTIFGANFIATDSTARFLTGLKGIVDPEKKRKIIGETFIRVFEDEAAKIANIDYLVQGTLYPDVIESVSAHGPSATIKTHHNVGGLPEVMNLKLIEPLRELFKDEVRNVGRELGLPEKILGRHPFPGPGLAVRILGDITEERLALLRDVDAIYIDELRNHNLYDEIWQAFAVLLPIKTVGVMGDQRTYESVVGLRAVTSEDGMTADWARIPFDVLSSISNRIINEVQGVNRVVYDVSSKPPGTIEWE